MTHENAPESTETAKQGSRALPDATDAGEALVQQIAEALRSSPNGPHLWLPGPTDLAPSFARAVLPLVEAQVAARTADLTRDMDMNWRRWKDAEAQVAPLRDEVEREVEHCEALGRRVEREVRARDAAESALRQVREDLTALADAGYSGTHASINSSWRADIAAVLARVGAADTQPEGALNVIFDGPPSHESGRFVEVETDDGRSINAGQWIERPDGLWALRITSLPSAGGKVEGSEIPSPETSGAGSSDTAPESGEGR
jgi:hypothetical protein